jgi:hypothetical protein
MKMKETGPFEMLVAENKKRSTDRPSYSTISSLNLAPEERSSIFLWNVINHIPDSTVI